MKVSTSTMLSTSAMLALAAAAPSSSSTYQLRVVSDDRVKNGAVLTLKDESATNTSPNAIGIFSSGEPRAPYTFSLSKSSINETLYDVRSSRKPDHLVLTGNRSALGVFDVPIGAEPKPRQGGATFAERFLVLEQEGKMKLTLAEQKYTGELGLGPGTWRLCTGSSDVDYTLYFYDGLSRLEDIIKGCKAAVELELEEAKPAAGTSGFITGVPAPTDASKGGVSLTGVPAPSSTSGDGAHLTCVLAPSTSGNGPYLTGVPAPSSTSGNGPYLTGVPAPSSDSHNGHSLTGVPAPDSTAQYGPYLTGVPAPSSIDRDEPCSTGVAVATTNSGYSRYYTRGAALSGNPSGASETIAPIAFEGAGSCLDMVGIMMSLTFVIAAFVL